VNALNGRWVYAPRETAGRGQFRDPYADICALADAVAGATSAELFNHNGRLIWLREGTLAQVTLDALHEIVAKNVVTQRLVNRGTADAPNWELVYSPCEPSRKELVTLITADSLKTGSLAARVMKA